MELFKEIDVLELLSEVISEGILVVDENHNIIASNARANGRGDQLLIAQYCVALADALLHDLIFYLVMARIKTNRFM